MTDEIVVIDSEEEENVVDNGTSYVSEETAEIAEQAAADAKRWAQESEYQAGLATNSADTAAQAKDDALSYYNLAKDWAIKTNGKVNNEDYSSKYYAQQSNTYATQAQTYAQSINPNNLVHKTGDETISGIKTFTSDPYIYNNFPTIYQRQPNFNKGDIPQAEIFANNAFMDGSGTLGSTHQLGTYGCAVTTTGEIRAYLRAYRNVEGSTDGANLEIRYPIDGNPYTVCPAPTDTTTTSGTQIATTGWVNSTNNNIVHKTGDETIGGTKTFTKNLYLKNSDPAYVIRHLDITKGTNPSVKKYLAINLEDSVGGGLEHTLGIFETQIDTDGTVNTGMFAYENTTNSRNSVYFLLTYPKTGNPYATAPKIIPSGDNVRDLGEASHRWKQLFAGTTTISTSDEREKQDIEEIPDEVLDAWGDVKFYRFKYKNAVQEKGENARYHIGLIAQRIKEVFENHNLNAFDYGLLCYDEWEDGNRYSLRYEECLCLEVAYQRRLLERMGE